MLGSWYGSPMEATPFDLTPEQKGLLVALAQETGKSIPILIAEALEELEEHVHARPGVPTNAGNGDQAGLPGDHERPSRLNVLGKWLLTSCKTSLKKTLPACLWTAPNSMTTTSTVHPNTLHETLFC